MTNEEMINRQQFLYELLFLAIKNPEWCKNYLNLENLEKEGKELLKEIEQKLNSYEDKRLEHFSPSTRESLLLGKVAMISRYLQANNIEKAKEIILEIVNAITDPPMILNKEIKEEKNND